MLILHYLWDCVGAHQWLKFRLMLKNEISLAQAGGVAAAKRVCAEYILRPFITEYLAESAD